MPETDQDALEKAVAEIRSKWGMHAIGPLGQQAPVSRIATGFSALDRLLGGGLPRGRITEISGAPTSGMVTLCFKTMAQAQARGEMAVYVDLEQSFDPYYAARCGVILDQMLLVRPAPGPRQAQQAMRVLEELIALCGDGQKAIAVLVCDLPLRALASEAAQVLATSLERLLAPLNRSETALVYLVSKVSNVPGTFSAHVPGTSKSAGDIESAWHVAHYASVRLLARRQRWIYRRQDIRGCSVRVRVLKNKSGPVDASVNVNVIFDDASPDDDERFTKSFYKAGAPVEGGMPSDERGSWPGRGLPNGEGP